MIEINSESKDRFFAQYYGLRVAICYNSAKDLQPFGCLSNCLIDDIQYLELRPLSSISGEDALFICEMSFRDLSSYDDQAKIAIGKRLIDSVVSDEASYFSGALCSAINDFLRSKGYALPWMGLSVEQMIQAGWIKLKES